MRAFKRHGLLSAIALAGVLYISGSGHADAAQAAAQVQASSIQVIEAPSVSMAVPVYYTYQGHRYNYRYNKKYYNYRYSGRYYNHRSYKNGRWYYY